MEMQVSSGDNGTATSPKGAFWISNPVMHVSPGVQYLAAAVGEEMDFSVESGASVAQKILMSLNESGPDAVPGSLADTMLQFAGPGLGSTAPGFKNIIQIGAINSSLPSNANTTFIMAQWNTAGNNRTNVIAGNGIDFRVIPFTGCSIGVPGVCIDGRGNTNIGPGVVSPLPNGVSFDAPNYVTSAAPTSGNAGTGYQTGDGVADDLGGLWTVTAGGGGAVTALAGNPPTYASTCPAAGHPT
jgi:hypothetical protein